MSERRNLSKIMEQAFQPYKIVGAYITLCNDVGRKPVVELFREEGGCLGYREVSTGKSISGESALELIFAQV